MPTAESKTPAEIAEGLSDEARYIVVNLPSIVWYRVRVFNRLVRNGLFEPEGYERTPLGRAVAAHLEGK
jgi:hypothetical protein